MTDEVTHLRPAELRGGRFGPCERLRPRRGRFARALRGMLVAKLFLGVALVVAVGALYLRLDSAPLRVHGLSEQIETALAQRLGPTLVPSLGESALTLHEGALALAVTDLGLYDANGALVARAPHAVVGIGTLSLLSGQPAPRSIVLSDVDLRARIARDGSVSLVPAQETPAQASSEPATPVEAEPLDPSYEGFAPALEARSSAALAVLLDPTTPFGALESARLDGARLTLVDEAGRERVALGRIDARIWTTGGRRSVEAQVASPRGTWTLRGAVEVADEGVRQAELALEGLPAYDLALMSGVSQRISGDGLLLGGSARLSVAPDGAVRRLAVSLEGGPGWLTTRDPFMPRVPVDTAALDAEWRPAEGLVAIERLAIAGGATRIALAGTLAAADEPGLWRIDLQGRDARVRGARDGEPPLRLDRVAVAGSAGPDGVVLDAVEVAGENISVAARISFGGEEDRGGLRVSVATRDIASRDALALWPDFVAPIPRIFLRDALREGHVRALDVAVALTGEDLASLLDHGSIPHEAVAVDFAIDEGVLALDADFPPLAGVSVTGRVTGRSASVEARAAELVQPGRSPIALGAGRMGIRDFWMREPRAEIAFEASGGLDALAALMRTPALEAAAGIALDPDTVSGDARLAVSFSFPLDEPFDVADLPIAASGRLTDVALGAVVGGETLDEGALDVVVHADGLVEIDGRARIGGIPARIAIAQPRDPAAEGEARIGLDLDAQALVDRGLLPPGRVRGAIPVEIVAPIGRGPIRGATIEAFLGGTRIDEPVPGFSKAAGVPGRLFVRVREGDANDEGGSGLLLEEITLEAGSALVRGSGRLTPEGALAALDIDQLRLSPGDDARLEVRRENGVTRTRLRGRSFDVRPLVASLQAGGLGGSAPSGGGGPAGGEPVEIDAAIDILTGHRGEVITSATLSARLVGQIPERLELAGRFPDAPLTARLDGGGLLVESADAGATLRFLGLYDNMIGGRLLLQAGRPGPRQDGSLVLREFSLRDEPALRRIAGSARVSDGRGGTVDISEAVFVKAQADFVREGGLLTLGDARMWGAQLGFTLSGWIDLSRDALDLAGAFVPAYGLNNAFAQVPLVGRLLGGNRYEGLIAVNFRVAGPMAEPVLTVNPLSAIAPGVLRNLFGAGTPTRPIAPDLGEAPLAPPLQITPMR